MRKVWLLMALVVLASALCATGCKKGTAADGAPQNPKKASAKTAE